VKTNIHNRSTNHDSRLPYWVTYEIAYNIYNCGESGSRSWKGVIPLWIDAADVLRNQTPVSKCSGRVRNSACHDDGGGREECNQRRQNSSRIDGVSCTLPTYCCHSGISPNSNALLNSTEYH